MIFYGQLLLLAMVMASLAYTIFTWLEAYWHSQAVNKFSGKQFSETAEWPEVVQVKPIHTLTAETLMCLQAFLEQDYPANMHYICAVGGDQSSQEETFSDKIVQLQEFAARQKRQFSLSLGAESGKNRKIAACIKALKGVKYDYLIISDADMRCSADMLKRMLQPLADAQNGMATALYIVKEASSLGAAFEGISVTDFAASVLVARRVQGVNFALGAVMAIRREVLEEIGGLEEIKHYLADDYQLGFRTSQTGRHVVLADTVVEDVVGQMSFSDYFSHQLRWMRTYRISRPGGFAAFMVTQGLVWSLALLLVSGLASWAWSILAGWCLVRTLSEWHIWRLLGGRQAPAAWWAALVCIKDLCYIVLWCMALAGNTVRWGDTVYRVTSDGEMEPIS